jgi:hypothetical protein
MRNNNPKKSAPFCSMGVFLGAASMKMSRDEEMPLITIPLSIRARSMPAETVD